MTCCNNYVLRTGIGWDLSLRELAEELAKTIFYYLSWLTKEISDDWSLANVTSIHKKAWKEDLGNYKHFHLSF